MEAINKECSHYNYKTTNFRDAQIKNIRKVTCIQCSNDRQKQCNHTPIERALVGFWPTIEVNKAIEEGYTLLKVYQTWHFPKRSDQLFREYIKMFYKIKQCSSGKCSTEIIEKMNKLGIDVKPEDFKKNPGLIFIAKVCLNNLWGKFGQRTNFPICEYVDNYQKFYKIITNDIIEDLMIKNVSDKMLMCSYRRQDAAYGPDFQGNIYIASFTTAHARLRLYNQIKLLQDQNVYCDTDGIKYQENDYTKQVVNFGSTLGEWKDELDGDYYTNFVSIAPKDYGGYTKSGKYIGKVKGLKIDALIEPLLTNENRLKLIKREIDGILCRQYRFVIRDNEIISKDIYKLWTYHYDKRIAVKVSDDLIDTYPYGFKNIPGLESVHRY